MTGTQPAPADAAGPPGDGHVHSECSWDAPYTSMEQACRRAVELGLPSIAFTDHADFVPRRIADAVTPPEWKRPLITDRVLTPPPLDVHRYLRAVDACRSRYPGLRIVSGVELGEPHRRRQRAAEVLGAGFERVLASVHTLPGDTGVTTVDAAFENDAAQQVVRRYLAEVYRLAVDFADFHVLAHIDYAARFWPPAAGEHRFADFAEEYRAVLAVLAASDKALEVNTSHRFDPQLLRWWREEGGRAITFGSDAHRPEQVARGFADASALAATAGFRPGDGPGDLWTRC
ncbi:histidinol-phosphatase HisJ family protein [Dactylosporangium matsuzakiense]|uniref:Histidinol-phosphatase n=1 Tax=Dactylosporangium matsuzakiense TaxID=53360 RepID=A0A9W6KFC4_9ACTN|nr:histidinol-phosphatase HisJ family protein [Dactylosporangium matsuzakiense]GLK99210.1 histidinol-phosphatase [Dactylosporangium matsuzakiense]